MVNHYLVLKNNAECIQVTILKTGLIPYSRGKDIYGFENLKFKLGKRIFFKRVQFDFMQHTFTYFNLKNKNS